MGDFLAGIEIQFTSFAIGFAAGAMFWWLFQKVQPWREKTWGRIKERFSRVRSGLSTSNENRYRVDAYRLFSRQHLAEPLFRMAEVAIPPRLIAPPPPIIPGEALPPEAITDIAVPYLPDMPEVGGQFQIKTITIVEAMSQGGNLLLYGPPGSGRTFAVCQLACQAALKEEGAGALADLIPIYVHAGGLDLSKADRPVEALYQALANQVSIMMEASLKDFFKATLEAGNALLLVDGLDELPLGDRPALIELLQRIQKNFPGNRYIVVTSPEDLSAQSALKLFPFAIAGWTVNEKTAFLNQWADLWQTHVPGLNWAKSLPEIFDPVVLNAWLYQDTLFASPFDLTLKAWAAYAGDSTGRTETAAIEAYLDRMGTGIMNARPALENLAAQSILNATPFLPRRTAAGYISSFEQEDSPPVLLSDLNEDDLDSLLEEVTTMPSASRAGQILDDDLDALLDELDDLEFDTPTPLASEVKTPAAEGETIKPHGRSLLPQLSDARLLVEHPNGRFGFIHPIFAGFLAGANLLTIESLQALNAQPDWSGKRLAQRFLPFYQADMLPFLTHAIQQAKQHPLQPTLVEASSWLRYVSGSPAWRSGFMRSLAASLQDESLPLGLRARILGNLVFSGATGINTLLRQMLHSPRHSVRWLAALGCGLTRDPEALDDLALLLYESSAFVSQAACLALATYGNQRALESLTRALLEADDGVRRAAAEALALHPEEGHPVLRDGAKVDDVSVRRAVVFGLARVKQNWAEQILLELQTGDDQWVVRNAAMQIVEDIKLDAISIPKMMPPLHETSWLIRYASEKGMGLAPGQASWDLLANALQEGNEETAMAAMYIFRLKPDEGATVVLPLVTLMSEREGEVREAAYDTLWHLDANRIPLQTV